MRGLDPCIAAAALLRRRRKETADAPQSAARCAACRHAAHRTRARGNLERLRHQRQRHRRHHSVVACICAPTATARRRSTIAAAITRSRASRVCIARYGNYVGFACEFPRGYDPVEARRLVVALGPLIEACAGPNWAAQRAVLLVHAAALFHRNTQPKPQTPTRSRHKPKLAFWASATRILSPAGAVPVASGCPLAVDRAVPLFPSSTRLRLTPNAPQREAFEHEVYRAIHGI